MKMIINQIILVKRRRTQMIKFKRMYMDQKMLFHLQIRNQ